MTQRRLALLLATAVISCAPALSDSQKGKSRDIEAIGHRDVGKGVNWYSLEQEITLGKALAQQVEAQSRIVSDPLVNEYVNRVSQNLVRNSDARVPFTIRVIDSNEINAFALPGGFFFVNSGIVLEAEEEAELAGVMAHEIAHVAARHGTRQATRAELAHLLSAPLVSIGGGAGVTAGQTASVLLPLSLLKFSRSFEREADLLGVQYLFKTGYDPLALVAFFEKIQTKENKRPGLLSNAFSSHPQTPDRIAASQQQIVMELPARAEHIVTTSEFNQVKARLRFLQGQSCGDEPAATPEFQLEYTVFRTATGFKIAGKIKQDQGTSGAPVELRINTDGKPELRRIDLTGAATDFSVETLQKPRQLALFRKTGP